MIYRTIEVNSLDEYLLALKTHHPSAVVLSSSMPFADSRYCLSYCKEHKDDVGFPQYAYLFHSRIVSDYYRGYSELSFKEVMNSVVKLLELEKVYTPVYGVLIDFFNFHGRICLRDGKIDIYGKDLQLRDEFYKKAVKINDPFAQFEYYEIQLIDKDTDFPVLLKQYEELGKNDFKYNYMCLARIAEMYCSGMGNVKQDVYKAYYYINEAIKKFGKTPYENHYLDKLSKRIEENMKG